MATTNTLLHRWFEEVWNQGDEAAVDKLISADCVIHGLDDDPNATWIGPAAFKQFYHQLRSAFSQIHIDVAESLADGDLIAVRCMVTGKQAGTGKPVRFGGITIGRAKDGKIVEGWNHYDFDAMRKQLA